MTIWGEAISEVLENHPRIISMDRDESKGIIALKTTGGDIIIAVSMGVAPTGEDRLEFEVDLVPKTPGDILRELERSGNGS